MGDQSVFHGALGWDDWIWWSGIGGVGLFLLLMVMCCCICVQRAKRKGREEAMASMQARQRELQQQQQAQLRYAQAQQARYPTSTANTSGESTYNFSKSTSPPPPRGAKKMPLTTNTTTTAANHTANSGRYVVRGPQVSANAYPLPNQQQHGNAAAYPSSYAAPQQQQYVAAPIQHTQYNQQTTSPPMKPTTENPYQSYDRPRKPSSTFDGSNQSVQTSGTSSIPYMSMSSPRATSDTSITSRSTVSLRERIEALREENVHDQHVRISLIPPIEESEHSEYDISTRTRSSPEKHFDEETYATARSLSNSMFNSSSTATSRHHDFEASSISIQSGQFDDAESSHTSHGHDSPSKKQQEGIKTREEQRAAYKAREQTSSRESVEF